MATVVAAPTALAETDAETLARRPFAPTQRELFATTVYPETAPMAPAAGGEPSQSQVATMLDAYLAEQFPGDAASQDAARAIFNSPDAIAKVPSASLRAALATLYGTAAQPAIAYILDHQTAGGHDEVTTVKFVPPAQMPDPTRAIGAVYGAGTADAAQMEIRFNNRYQAENPFLFMPIMAHEALHLGNGQNSNVEEQVNTSFDGLLGTAQLARHPGLALLGTELARRFNSRAIVRLNSGVGTSLGLYATNLGAQVFPGSSAEPARSWYEAHGADMPAASTPGFALLGDYLTNTHSAGAPVCSAAEFSKALLDCIDANGNAGLSPAELVAAANAMKLDLGTPAGPGPDATAPVVTLSGKKRQKLGGAVAVMVSCDEACVATATGKVRAGKRTIKLRKASKQVAAGAEVTLKLRLPGKARRAAGRALEHHKGATAKLSVAVQDPAGNRASKKRTVKLARRP